MSLKVTLLGTSAGGPVATRNTTSTVVTVDGLHTVLDTGGGFCRAFLQAGFDPLGIQRIIVSHTHADHTAELALALQMYYLAYAKDPLEIFVPLEFVEPFRSFLNAVYLMPERLPFEVKLVGYGDKHRWEGKLQIAALGNSHLAKYRDWVEKLSLPNQCQAYSFSLKYGAKHLYFSADVGSYADIHTHLKDHDALIIESAHLSLDEFFTDAQHHPMKHFVLTHLVSEAQAADLDEKIMLYQLTNVVVAEDGYSFELK